MIAYGINKCGKKRRIRAMWIPEFTVEADGDNYLGDDEVYSEEKDCYYWPEGWYEKNEMEECHWRVDFEITDWCHLPEFPQ